ncbi:MAG: DUF1849 family protein [Alphaproteobacteria bacterium]|nr:MAG: DUF1849 family protein [Alphaproteobacteria bacterium]
MSIVRQPRFIRFAALFMVAASLLALPPAAAAKRLTSSKPAVAATPDDVTVALHRALYDFKMVSVQSGAGITDISGRMYYEQDDDCDAWTTEHRFRVKYQYSERRPVQNTSHYVAFESKDLSQFFFSSEREEDGATTEQLRGSIAKAADGTAKADYARPGNLSYALPKGYMLPTQQTNEVIRRARRGESFFNVVMFDGTDSEGPVEVNTYIGKKVTPEEIKAIAAGNPKIDASLLAPEAWHVRMAVFPLKERDDMSASYEMDMILHDNGVVSWSLVDYRSFRVEQKLLAIEKLPQKKCS